MNRPILGHLGNCGSTAQTGHRSLIGTNGNQMKRCLESTEGRMKLHIRVFPNTFSLILQCDTDHCRVGKSLCHVFF